MCLSYSRSETSTLAAMKLFEYVFLDQPDNIEELRMMGYQFVIPGEEFIDTRDYPPGSDELVYVEV